MTVWRRPSISTFFRPLPTFSQHSGTKWYGWNSATRWIQNDFGANSAQIVKRYTLICADVADRDPTSWDLLGSHEGASWTTLDSKIDQTLEMHS